VTGLLGVSLPQLEHLLRLVTGGQPLREATLQANGLGPKFDS
jgi:hypothetical protein